MNLVDKRIIFTIALLFIYTLGIKAQTTQIFSLDECRSMAIDASNNVKSSREKILYSKDIADAYKANYFPDISVKGTYIYSTISCDFDITGGDFPTYFYNILDEVGIPYMYDLDINSIYNARVVLTQPIYMGGKITRAYKLAKLGVESSYIDEQRVQSQVLELVDNAFYQILELEAQELSSQRYIDVVQEFLRQVENAYNQGMKSRNDVMKVNVILNDAKLINQKLINGLALAKMNLCYLIGLPLATTDFVLEEPLMQIEQICYDTLDITHRPEYALLEKQVEAKQLDVKITRGDFLPSVAAVSSYGYTNGISLNNSTLLDGGDFFAGVSVNIPLFHWLEGRKRVSAKKREMNIAQNTLEDLSMQMKLEMMQAINEVNEAIMQVNLTENALIQAEENVRLSKNQFDVGMETISDYLEALSLWQKAASDNSSAKKMQRVAYTKYLKTIGELK